MAEEVASLYVKVSASTKDFEKSMNAVDGKVKSAGGAMKGVLVGGAIAATAAIAGLGFATVQYGQDAVAASDMGETVSKTNVLFGTSADKVRPGQKPPLRPSGRASSRLLTQLPLSPPSAVPLGLAVMTW